LGFVVFVREIVERNRKEYLRRTFDVAVVEQWRIECIFNRFSYTILPFAIACAHEGDTPLAQHCADILEVKVDDAMHRDDLCDRSCSSRERCISLFKRRTESEVGIYRAQQFIVDHQKRIHLFGNSIYTIKCLVNLFIPLELEGNSDNTYGEDATFFGFMCNDRGSTCACATTHTSSDKHHLGVGIEQGTDLIDAFVGCLSGAFRAVACTKTIFTKLHLIGYWRIV